LYIDDVYITLKYVDNLINNNEWGMYPDIPANSATSPGNVLVLYFFTLLVTDSEASIIIYNFSLMALMIFVFYRIDKKNSNKLFLTYFAVPLLILNPFLFSSLGLESLSIVSFFSLLILLLMQNKILTSGFLLGILYLFRPDSIILALPFVFTQRKLINIFKIIIMAFFTILPWISYSIIKFGSIFPDTLIIKRIQSSWGSFNFGNGLMLYFDKYPLEMTVLILSFSFLFSLFFTLNFKKRIRFYKLPLQLFIGSTTHFLFYYKLGVPPYHWYYVPSLSALMLCILFLYITSRSNKKEIFFISFNIIWIVSIILVFLKAYNLNEMPIHTNWLNRNDYLKVAHIIDSVVEDKQKIAMDYEIGTISYFSKNAIFLNEFSNREKIIEICHTKPTFSILELNNLIINLSCLDNKVELTNKENIIKISSFSSTYIYKIGPYSTRWQGDKYLYIQEKEINK
jgi:hypothetical protein